MRYWRQTPRIREAIFGFFQRPQAGAQSPTAHVCSSAAARLPSHAGTPRQLRKSGANSRQPSRHAHRGVVRHCSKALQQLSRRQERQLGSLGPWHTIGSGPVVPVSDPSELELVATVVLPWVDAVSTSPIVLVFGPLAPAAPDEVDVTLELPCPSVPVDSSSKSPPRDAVTEQPPTIITSSRARLMVLGIRPEPSL